MTVRGFWRIPIPMPVLLRCIDYTDPGDAMIPPRFVTLLLTALLALPTLAEDPPKPDASKMPHMSVDVKRKQIRVECQALNPQMSLEFFCCMTGTAEHE